MLPVQNYYIRNKLSEHDFYKPLILEKQLCHLILM